MARANTVQTNFTSGEVSPLMYGRVDVTKYFNGARKLTNMVVLPQGGAFRRPGTQYQGETKSSGYAQMRKFIFSTTQAYMLEFGNLYVRFWKSSGRVESPPGTPVEVATPYLVADIPYLVFAQSADVVYITHPHYPPQKLERLSDTNWSLVQVQFLDGPYIDADPTTTNRVKVAVTSDTTTMVSNATGTLTAIASSAIFGAGDAGKYVDYVKDDYGSGIVTWGLAIINSNTDSTHDQVTIQSNVIYYITGSNTITFGSGHVSASSPIFSTSSVGKFIRLSGSQAWYKVTAYLNSTTVSATAQTIISYSYPSTKVIISVGFAVGDVNKFVEFQVAGVWKLAQITAFTSLNNVTVKVIDQVLIPDSGTTITLAAGSGVTTANKTGIFSPGDTGKYIRDSNSQAWAIITSSPANTDKANTTQVTMFAYSFPSITMTLLNDRSIAITIECRDALFDPINDSGVTVRLKYGATWRYAIITALSSPKNGTGTLSDFMPFDQNNANNPFNGGFADLFRVPAWTTANGWPSVCAFHNGRLWFGNTLVGPTTIWGSNSDDYENMSPTDETGAVLDSSAITLVIANNEVNPIIWIKSGPVMLVGTQGLEFQVKSSGINFPITPTNVNVNPQTAYGSIDTQQNSVRINSQTLFVQRGGLKVREMSYDFNIDAYESRDISILSEHYFRSAFPSTGDGNPLTTNVGIVSMDLGNNPITIGWFVLNNGDLVGMTYEKEQEVIAFHKHQIGSTSGTIGFVESVCVTPDSGASTDVVWLIVKRTLNGSVKRFIETFTILQIFDEVNETKYADCFKLNTATGDVTDSNGFDHLGIGSVVQVTVDGIAISDKTIAATTTPSGTGFNLKYHVSSYVMAGFKSTCIVGLLDPEGGSQAGSSQAKKKRVAGTAVRVENSPHFKIASAPGFVNTHETVMAVKEPTSSDYTLIVPDITITAAGTVAPFPVPAAAKPTFYTGDITATTDDAFDNGGRLSIVQDNPYPLKVVAVFHKLDTNE